VEGNGIQDVHEVAFFNPQVFDDVEGIHLGSVAGDLGQIPSEGWGWPSETAGSIQGTASFKDASDGPYGGDRRVVCLSDPFSLDGGRAVFSEIAVVLEGSSQIEDMVFDRQAGSVDGGGGSGRVGAEVDAVESLVAGPMHPVLNGRQGDAEMSCDGPHRQALAYQADQGSTALFNTRFLVIRRSPMSEVFADKVPCKRSPCDLRMLTLD